MFETSEVPEGHHSRGTTTLREALRGNLPLRGLCGGLSEGSAGALRGLFEGSAGLCGGPRDFSRFFGGSEPMLVTLGNCWRNRTPRNRIRPVSENLSPQPVDVEIWVGHLSGLGVVNKGSSPTGLHWKARPLSNAPVLDIQSRYGLPLSPISLPTTIGACAMRQQNFSTI